jgi:hypothetical protein
LVHEAKESLVLFLEANEKQGQVYEFQSAAGGDTDAWRRPPHGVYKINWDVGLDEKTGRLGVGVIIRDSEGMVIAARSLTIQIKQDPVIREARGAIYAAEFGRDIGVQNVILEGDFQLWLKRFKLKQRI